jgi:hypothetical protein
MQPNEAGGQQSELFMQAWFCCEQLHVHDAHDLEQQAERSAGQLVPADRQVKVQTPWTQGKPLQQSEALEQFPPTGTQSHTPFSHTPLQQLAAFWQTAPVWLQGAQTLPAHTPLQQFPPADVHAQIPAEQTPLQQGWLAQLLPPSAQEASPSGAAPESTSKHASQPTWPSEGDLLLEPQPEATKHRHRLEVTIRFMTGSLLPGRSRG